MAKVEFKAAWKALKARASPDGGININSVDLNGKLDASYANPKPPLPFHTAEVVRRERIQASL